MNSTIKTHYRAAFNSPYLSSSDLVEPVILTIKRVALESDKTKRTKERFNTCYFVEGELRRGEPLKPMILNSINSRTLRNLSGSPYIEDWAGLLVTVLVESNIPFGTKGNFVDGLRISPLSPKKTILTPDNKKSWDRAKTAYKRDGNLDSVLSKVEISDADQEKLKKECDDVA